MPDKEIQCAGCGKAFTLTAREQQRPKGQKMSEPTWCNNCRPVHRPQQRRPQGIETEAKKKARHLLFGPTAGPEGGKKSKRGE